MSHYANFRKLLVMVCAIIVVITGKTTQIHAQQHPFAKESITDVAWSPDYKLLATSQFDGTVTIRDTSGIIIKTLSSDKQAVHAISWSPDGNFLAVGGDEANIKIWDVEASKIVQTVPAFNEGVFGLAWQPTSKVLLASGFDYFRAWDTSTWQPITKALSVTLYDMQWSPDGSKFAFTAGKVGIAVIQKDGNVEITNFDGQDDLTAPAYSVSWNSTGTQLVSGGRDGTVRLWDVASGKQIKILLQTQSDEWIQSVAFDSATDSKVAAVSSTGRFYLIDLSTAKIQQTDYPDTDLWRVAWNPIENSIALGGTSQKKAVASTNSMETLLSSGMFEIVSLSKK